MQHLGHLDSEKKKSGDSLWVPDVTIQERLAESGNPLGDTVAMVASLLQKRGDVG